LNCTNNILCRKKITEWCKSSGMSIKMRLEEIKTLAVTQFCRVTGIDEHNVRRSMVICCVGENCEWIEFHYEDHFFHYNMKRQYRAQRF
jgi:hypothetical protein